MKRILGLLVLSLFVLSVIKSSAQSNSEMTSENTISPKWKTTTSLADLIK